MQLYSSSRTLFPLFSPLFYVYGCFFILYLREGTLQPATITEFTPTGSSSFEVMIMARISAGQVETAGELQHAIRTSLSGTCGKAVRGRSPDRADGLLSRPPHLLKPPGCLHGSASEARLKAVHLQVGVACTGIPHHPVARGTWQAGTLNSFSLRS